MTSQTIAEYVKQFMASNGVDDDIIEAWTETAKTKEVKNMIKTKKPKDKDAPKKSKSAYIYFCSANRAAIKEELGEDAKNTDITRRLAELWADLKDDSDRVDELKEYAKLAEQDKDRYDTQKADYTPKTKVEKTPARGKNAYIFFCMEKRQEAKKTLGGDAKNTEITVKLSEMWNDLKNDPDNTEEIERYKALAAEDKALIDGDKLPKKAVKKIKEPKEPKVKEPKVKEPKEPKAPKEKAPKPPKEPKVKPAKEPKEPKVKAPKEPKEPSKPKHISKKKALPQVKQAAGFDTDTDGDY